MENQDSAFDWTNTGLIDQSTATSPSSADSNSNKTSESNKKTQEEPGLSPRDAGKTGTNGHVTDASKSSESMTSTGNNSKSGKSGSEKKKKGSAWYNVSGEPFFSEIAIK